MFASPLVHRLAGRGSEPPTRHFAKSISRAALPAGQDFPVKIFPRKFAVARTRSATDRQKEPIPEGLDARILLGAVG